LTPIVKPSCHKILDRLPDMKCMNLQK
jgi:hypothetical protein